MEPISVIKGDGTYFSDKGPFKCYITLFSWTFDPHPPPRNANNVDPYTFVRFFPGNLTPPPHPPLCYVTLEWPLKGDGTYYNSDTSGWNPFQW